MRRLVLAALLLPFAGCSYSSQFVIANRSSSALHVTYRVDNALAPVPYRDRGCLIEDAPELYVLGRNDDVTERHPANETRSADPAGCSVALLLPPGRGVGVWRALNYDAGDRDRPFITSIEIASPALTRKFAGVDVVKVFERRSRTLYVLRVAE